MDLLPRKKIIVKAFIFLFLIFNIINFCNGETKKLPFQFKPQESQKMTLSLYSNQNYFGEFQAFVSSDGIMEKIDKNSFLKMMKSFLVKEKYDEFVSSFLAYNFLTSKQLASFGLDIFFENSNFKLDIRAPDTFLNPSHVSLLNQSADNNVADINPAFFTAFSNYSFNKQFINEDTPDGKRSSLTGSIDPVINVNDTLIESHHILIKEGQWQRTGSRLTKDIVSEKVRISAGDLNYSPRTFQTAYQFLGVSLSSAFDINPTTVVTSLGEREIFLETPSVVEVFINGFLIQTLTLEPGKHLLEDIPVSLGINHIVLRITDNSGTVKFILFQHTGGESMLRSGLHEFSYNIGSYSLPGITKIRYEKDPLLSFYHRYGVNNLWTTGVNTQVNKSGAILGGENQFGTNRGLFVHNLAFSELHQQEQGVATKLSYIWTCPCGSFDQIKRLAFSYEYQSPNYLANIVNSSFVLNNLRHIIQLTYNQKITEDVAGIVQSNVSTLNFKNLTSTQLSSGLNFKMSKNLFSNIYWTKTQTKTSGITNSIESILLQFNYNFDDNKKSINTTINTSNEIKNIQNEFVYSENKAVDNRIYRLRVAEDNQRNKSAFVGSYLNTQYNELSASLDYQNINKKKEININPTGSLTFINGKFTLGQRINQSFIVVDNELKESVIINGGQENHEGYLASNERMVLTGVQPYFAKAVNIVSDDNQSLGLANKEYKVGSNYRTGSYLKLGNSLSKTIRGILVNETGKPLSLVGAKLINLASGIEIPFFTGRDGVFIVDNVKPDDYQVIIYGKLQVNTINLNLNNRLKEDINNLGKLEVK